MRPCMACRSCSRVEQVAFDESEAAIFQRVGRELLPAGDQIVEADDVVAVGEQAVHQIAPDKPGAARDEMAGHVYSLSFVEDDVEKLGIYTKELRGSSLAPGAARS